MLGLVPFGDELLDGGDQRSHTAEHPPLNRLSVQDRELRISGQTDQWFRLNPITGFGGIRSPWGGVRGGGVR